MSEDVLTTSEAAAALKIHPRTWIRYWREGKLRRVEPIETGRGYRWRAEDVNYIKEIGFA